MSMDPKIAWFAGLYEGEGTIRWNSGAVHMVIGSTDHDVLLRVQRTVGGCVNGPYHRPPRKPVWYWSLNNWREVIPLAEAILPLLGARRRAQVEAVLSHRPAIPRGVLACPVVPEPSSKGYDRHRSLGIPVCDTCRESKRLKTAAQRASSKRSKI